jgi:YfiH family protein
MNLKQQGGVFYYSFPHMEEWPELTQAVLGRFGGVSEGPFASLNLSYAVDDDPGRVRTNRATAARSLGWNPAQFVSARQVHGRRVGQVVREMVGGPDLPDTDVLVTNEPGMLLLLKFADCVPVVLWDPVRRVIGLAHAGWRGTVLGAPAAAVEAMVEQFGSSPEDILAGIGPSIGPCCYQVGPDVEKMAAHVFAGAGVLQRGDDEEVRFDLWSANSETLMRAGVNEEKVVKAGICTRCRSDLFFSHRASGGTAGRFGALVGIRDE